MNKRILIFIITGAIVSLFTYPLGGESALVSGIPLIWLLSAYCFLVQFIAFIPAAILNTEIFYDLTGSLTYLSTLGIALYFNKAVTTKQQVAVTIIGIWAFRLGAFLFKRIHDKGFDSRFQSIKKTLMRFFFSWFFQGVWTVITPAPLLVIITKSPQFTSDSSFNALEFIGLLIWFSGFIFQCMADYQKSVFNSKEQNKGKFINIGVWSISRHPNYAGQIILWTGASVYAFSSLHGWDHLALISPIFVYLLLTKLSGVPILQKQAQQRWGKQEAYKQYRNSTPVLFPFVKQQNIQSKQK